MTDFYDKTRLLVAKLERLLGMDGQEGERWPVVIGAVPMSTWEIIPPEEWDALKREMAEKWLGPDWTAYDFIEVVVTIPSTQLAEMFDAREITPVAVERDA